MLIYCTLFDSKYLSRGLAMYESLRAHTREFRLYIFAFDEITAAILKSFALEHVVVIELKDFEDPDLLAVKPTRNPVEYCWTSTPSTIRYILATFKEPHCTYIDADLYFFGDPAIIFSEMGTQSVMITEHRYTPRYDLSSFSGKYCVQYITFMNTPEGNRVLEWWRNACLEWCYAREEEGKFGDQKYLDDWPERFTGIHVLQHPGGGVAPWNAQQYALTKGNISIDGTEIKTGISFPLIFYHFHYLRYYERRSIDLGDYVLTGQIQQTVYYPYLRHLDEIVRRLELIHPDIDWYGSRNMEKGLNRYIVMLKRLLKLQYNVFPLGEYKKRYMMHR
ncbi:MAG: glycosyl transferase [Bacteroidota bacterium]